MQGNVVFAVPLLRSNTHLAVFCAAAFSLSIDNKNVIDFDCVTKPKGDAIRGSAASKIVHAIASAPADPMVAV
jgi:hypothetical protein